MSTPETTKKRVEYFAATLILLSFIDVIVNFFYIFISINFFSTKLSSMQVYLLFMVANLVFILLVFLFFYYGKRAILYINLNSHSPENRYLISDNLIDTNSETKDEVVGVVNTIWDMLLIQLIILFSFYLYTYIQSLTGGFRDDPAFYYVLGYFIVLVIVVLARSRYLIRVVRVDTEKRRVFMKFVIVFIIIQPVTIILLFYADQISTAIMGSSYSVRHNFYMANYVIYSLFILLLVPLYPTIHGVVDRADKPLESIVVN